MQPDRDPQQWQQPSEQPSQAPYEAVPTEAPRPAVTLTPEPTSSAPAYQPRVSDDTLVDDGVAAENPAPTQEEPVHWQATEYIHHHKGTMWFIVFGIVVLAGIAAAIFLMKSVTFAVLVPVMAAALLVYAHRPPRILDYTLSRQGLHVNDRLYSFTEFKSFGVIHDGDEYSVMLIPTKRFKPGVSVYFPEEAGEAIVDMLAVRLPMRDLHLDMVDQVIRKLRI